MDDDIFRRQDALDAGFHSDSIDRKLRSGRWRRLRAGVYVLETARTEVELADRFDISADHRRAVLAAQARIAAPVWASHQSAAILHRLPLVTLPERVTLTGHPVAEVISVVSSRLYRDLRVFPAGVPVKQTTTVSDVPCLTVPRTVVDLARHLPVEEALVVADAAVRRGSTDPTELRGVAGTCHRWPGIRRAGRVISLTDGRRESPLESLSAGLFAVHGLDPGEPQQEILDGHRRFIGRVDFLWPEWRVVGEADGKLKYVRSDLIVDSEPYDRWHQERERQRRIELAGFRVVRWNWREVRVDPLTVIRRIRETMLLAVRDGLAQPGADDIAAVRRALFLAA